MNFDQILKDKGHDVLTLKASESLESAARCLDEKKIGAIIATDDAGGIVGVLSERDIVRQVARHGQSALAMQVADAMTRDLVVGHPTETLEQGLSRMTDRRIRHLPIVDGDKLIGIISIGDLVKWKIAETEAEAEAMKSYIASG